MTRILAWNLERKKVESLNGQRGTGYLFSQSPDIIVASETRVSFPLNGGHIIYARPPLGRFQPDERKVLLWSKNPWHEVDELGSEELPVGRFISGITETVNGPVKVVGVCIPWHMADVRYGSRNRTPWEQHKAYLKVLPSILYCDGEPLIVAGDFNQRIPKAKYGNRAIAEALESSFQPLDIVTRGVLDGTSKQGLNHIALDKRLTLKRVWGWPNVLNDNRITDHEGAGCDFLCNYRN